MLNVLDDFYRIVILLWNFAFSADGLIIYPARWFTYILIFLTLTKALLNSPKVRIRTFRFKGEEND